MKRQTSVILVALIAIFVQTGIAQNGYKNFTFGETIEQVHANVQGWKTEMVYESNCFTVAYLSDRAKTPETAIPNPLAKIEGRVTGYASEKPELSFIFVDSKLVAVEVNFSREYVLSDLEKKYGAGKANGMTIGSACVDTKVWFKDANRIVTYEGCHESGWGSKINDETVSYISRKTYDWLKGMLLQEENAKKSKTRSKID